MSMHIVYLKPHDGHKPGTIRHTEVSLARRLCEKNWAMPYQDWLREQKKQEQVEKEKEPEAAKEAPKKKPKRKYRKREKAVTIEK